MKDEVFHSAWPKRCLINLKLAQVERKRKVYLDRPETQPHFEDLNTHYYIKAKTAIIVKNSLQK